MSRQPIANVTSGTVTPSMSPNTTDSWFPSRSATPDQPRRLTVPTAHAAIPEREHQAGERERHAQHRERVRGLGQHAPAPPDPERQDQRGESGADRRARDERARAG